LRGKKEEVLCHGGEAVAAGPLEVKGKRTTTHPAAQTYSANVIQAKRQRRVSRLAGRVCLSRAFPGLVPLFFITQGPRIMNTSRLFTTIVWCALAGAGAANAAEGMIEVRSSLPSSATMDKLERLVKEKGMTVFARIDHAAGAKKIGKSLRPTEVLIFGNPQGGTPFMECAQTVGIDLPLKALVWEDASAQVWLGYNEPAYLAKRHGVPTCSAADGMAQALAGFAAAATTK
jgi:uncharacterized protein (DUF302 family)